MNRTRTAPFMTWGLAAAWLLCAALPARGQDDLPREEASGRVRFHYAVPVAGVKRAELFARATRWGRGFAAQERVQVNARARTVRVGPVFGEFEITSLNVDGMPYQQQVRLWFVVEVQVQEGAYTYDVRELLLEHASWPEPELLESVWHRLAPTRRAEYRQYVLSVVSTAGNRLQAVLSGARDGPERGGD